MAARLEIFDLRFLPVRRAPRWHYPDRVTARDLDASSFIIGLFHDADREIIGSVMFAVLAPDLENREFGRATLLATTVMKGPEEQPRHYADLRDSSGLRLIAEKELVTCAAPELRARMGR